jgi:hypothetical protein
MEHESLWFLQSSNHGNWWYDASSYWKNRSKAMESIGRNQKLLKIVCPMFGAGFANVRTRCSVHTQIKSLAL